MISDLQTAKMPLKYQIKDGTVSAFHSNTTEPRPQNQNLFWNLNRKQKEMQHVWKTVLRKVLRGLKWIKDTFSYLPPESSRFYGT